MLRYSNYNDFKKFYTFSNYFQQGNTPLHLATLGNFRHIIEILVQAQCDVNIHNNVSIVTIMKT